MLRNTKIVPRKSLLIDNDYSVDLDPERQNGYIEEIHGRLPNGYDGDPTATNQMLPQLEQSQQAEPDEDEDEEENSRGQRTVGLRFLNVISLSESFCQGHASFYGG